MEVALLGFLAVLILAFVGIPLAFAVLTVGIAGITYLRGFEAAIAVSSQWIIDTTMNHNLTIIPMFILMGSFIHRSGVSKDLFDAAYAWTGRFRGGLALSGILSCAGFSAVCGSSLATAATMSRVAIPPMRSFNYSGGFAAGTIAAGGTLGILIPPSVPLVIYGIIGGQDIALLFMAGVLPGILFVALFMLAVAIVTFIRPEIGPAGEPTPFRQALSRSRAAWPIMALLLLILAGIYSGVFTPTEAAAVGCFGAWLFGAFRGHFLNWRSLREAFEETVATTAMVFAILYSALILAQFVNLSGMPYDLQRLVIDTGLGPGGLVLIICAICLLLGMVFESLGILLLIIPVFLPALQGLGVDLIWFGILIIVVIELGLISPPIGLNVFTVSSIVPDIPLGSIFLGVLPYIIAMLVGLMLLFAIPDIVLLLPDAMR